MSKQQLLFVFAGEIKAFGYVGFLLSNKLPSAALCWSGALAQVSEQISRIFLFLLL